MKPFPKSCSKWVERILFNFDNQSAPSNSSNFDYQAIFYLPLEVRILKALFALMCLFLLFAKGHALKPQVASIFTSFLDGLKKFYITKVILGFFNIGLNFACYS